jgi:NAD(P)H dehydrogenase (quinone)
VRLAGIQINEADCRTLVDLMLRADGLAFVAPIFWMNFPAILRGWMERVFTYGFVYTMTRDAWLQGDLSGRQPLPKQRKALIIWCSRHRSISRNALEISVP